MEKRLILFLILSAVIFIGWSHFFAPKPQTPSPGDQGGKVVLTTPSPSPSVAVIPESQQQSSPDVSERPAIQAEARQVRVKSDYWEATLSNKGGVVTDWTMTRFPDGRVIDPPKGVNLISNEISQKVGAPFRFYIPSDPSLEKELNTASYNVENLPDQEVTIEKGQRKEIRFTYANKGVAATKTLVFKGMEESNSSGFDFDFIGSVRRNGSPVPSYIVIGPNFGDQSVKEVSTYKHAPQLTYATIEGDVKRLTTDSFKGESQPLSAPVIWAAVDDNYFAMAFVPAPPQTAPAIGILNDKLNNKYVSAAVPLNDGAVNHIYAGPKDLAL